MRFQGIYEKKKRQTGVKIYNTKVKIRPVLRKIKGKTNKKTHTKRN